MNENQILDDIQEVSNTLNEPLPRPKRFEVHALIGSGAYGSVYSAQDMRTGRFVAIKNASMVVTDHGNEDHGVPVTLIRETALLKALKHPNVVQLLEQIVRLNRIFLVFELCECNLKQYLEELRSQDYSGMPLMILRNLSFQIMTAIAYCHERRVIHRDLKPDNILLDTSRQIAKIADFGLARILSLKQETAYTGMAATIHYRPPEIILGATKYGNSVDAWSMGCILAEMATLKVTFHGDNEVEMLMKIFQQFGTPTEESWPNVTNLPYLLVQFPKWDKSSRPVCEYEDDPNLVQLVASLLQMYPDARITAREAVRRHRFFNWQEVETAMDGGSAQEGQGGAGNLEHTLGGGHASVASMGNGGGTSAGGAVAVAGAGGTSATVENDQRVQTVYGAPAAGGGASGGAAFGERGEDGENGSCVGGKAGALRGSSCAVVVDEGRTRALVASRAETQEDTNGKEDGSAGTSMGGAGGRRPEESTDDGGGDDAKGSSKRQKM